MPNHVKNIIKFKNLKSKDDIDLIINMITTRVEGPYGEMYLIDFNKIIPEPQEESECPDEFKMTEDSLAAKSEDRPWFDWYKWHCANWDTKWNAYDCDTKIGKSYVQFVFNTAWTFPWKVISKLALLGYDIDVKYADEDWGSNCGRACYTNITGWCFYDETELKHPKRFAKEIWSKY